MFTAALFTIAKTWKQPTYPLTDEWIKKLRYIWNQILLSHKRNAYESVLMRWMNLEPIIQSEVSQKREIQILNINAYIWDLERWY